MKKQLITATSKSFNQLNVTAIPKNSPPRQKSEHCTVAMVYSATSVQVPSKRSESRFLNKQNFFCQWKMIQKLTMSMIKRIMNIILFVCGLSAAGLSSAGWSGWHWSDFAVHDRIGLNEDISPNSLVTSLNHCLSVLADEFNPICEYAGSKLILLSRIDDQHENTVSISNRFLSSIPHDYEHEFYYLRKYAARALARRGLPDKLFEELDEFNNEPDFDDYLLLAESGNFIGKDALLTNLMSNDPLRFCQTTLFIDPFLNRNYPARQDFLKILIKALSSDNDYLATCAAFKLFNLEGTHEIDASVRSIIVDLLSSNHEKLHARAGLLMGKWPLTANNEKLITQIIKSSITTHSNNVRALSMHSLKDAGYLANIFVLEDPQQGYFEGTGSNIGGASATELLHLYLKNEAFGDRWRHHADQLKFTDYQDIFLNFAGAKDIEKKLSYFLSNIQKFDNRELKLKLANLALEVKSNVADSTLRQLYQNSNQLQKNVLITKYPSLFSDQKAIFKNRSDQWLELIDLVNLMNLCKTEPLPISPDLDDDKLRSKFIDQAFNRIKRCDKVTIRSLSEINTWSEKH